MMQETFIDPYTKGSLSLDSQGNLYRQDGDDRVTYRSQNGCYDLVVAGQNLQMEKEYYDKEHSAGSPQQLTVQLVKKLWFDETIPWYKTFLDSLGELSGKRVLLVGNGCSPKEFYFPHLGASVVFTDLSIEAVKAAKSAYQESELSLSARGTIDFHAVDGTHLPFPDNAFDIIYGSAFVHHLDNLDPFLSEVRRCLKPRGICRFFDQADSPLWTTMKRTVLRPLQLYSYWRHPRSPEDLRANLRCVFNEATLRSKMKEHDFRELLFMRQWFFGCVRQTVGKKRERGQ
jgi:ubiquinone/menaquinone biosynthesis C-methylase UbiE